MLGKRLWDHTRASHALDIQRTASHPGSRLHLGGVAVRWGVMAEVPPVYYDIAVAATDAKDVDVVIPEQTAITRWAAGSGRI